MSPLKPLFDYIGKERSHIYGVFLFWVIVGFAPVIFTTLFVSQDLIYKEKHLLKGEYIHQTFLNFSHLGAWLYVMFVVLGAGLLTWLTIWKFPKWVVNRAYKEELRDYYTRENMKLDEEDNLNKRKARLAQEQLNTVVKEEAVIEKQEQLESKGENTWAKEYNNFKKTDLYRQFHLIPRAIYEYSGRISVTDFDGDIVFEVPTKLLAYADSNALITVEVEKRTIGLTDKGRFFIAQYEKE